MSPIQRRLHFLDIVRQVLILDLHLDVQPEWIDPDVSLYGTGLGLDSVDAVDLAVGVQKRSGVRIPDGPQGRVALRSVNALVDLLVELADAPA